VFWRSEGEQFLWSTAAAILNHRNNYLNPSTFRLQESYSRKARRKGHRSIAIFRLAKKLVRGGVDKARVILGWEPGGDAPFLIEASTTQGGVSLQVARQELPPDGWFRIEAIVGDLELTERDWATDLRAGYFRQPGVPWER
jgi:hypothetical protein